MAPPSLLNFIDPASQLEGELLDGRWLVTKLLPSDPNATGGYFSFSYEGIDQETKSSIFLKALSLVSVLKLTNGNVLRAIQGLTNSHTFEISVLDVCRAANLERVVKLLGHGELSVNDPDVPFPLPIPYIVFELTEIGNAYKLHTAINAASELWKIKTLHEVAVALQQLHTNRIAHKDVKPSNVIFFKSLGAKLCDLGRATSEDHLHGPNENLTIACQVRYAPIEHLYQFAPTTRDEKNYGADLYHLGSLCYQFYSSVPLTFSLLSKIPADLRPDLNLLGPLAGKYRGNYLPLIAPVTKALTEVLIDITPAIPYPVRAGMVNLIGQLCNPDPSKRGHPKDHRRAVGRKFSVERYIAQFNTMYSKLKISGLR